MAKREDIRKILIIGSGPIIIGQACEFDYSGTQACKALRAEGYDVVLVNSNPATIMTDPGMADHTYIEPLTVDRITAVIEKERPDALLPNLGGQTALNLASKLHEEGILKQYGVEVIGVDLEAIARGEDRIIFKETMDRIGVPVAKSEPVYSVEEAEKVAAELGYPVVLRPAYTMGGTGGGIVYNVEELRQVVPRGLAASLINQVPALKMAGNSSDAPFPHTISAGAIPFAPAMASRNASDRISGYRSHHATAASSASRTRSGIPNGLMLTEKSSDT